MATVEQLSENSRQGVQVQKPPCIGLEGELSRNLHWGCGHVYDETPVDIAVYVRNDPVNKVDPDGQADTCASTPFYYNDVYEGTVGDLINAHSDVSIMAVTMYLESGHGSGVDVYEEEAIGAVLMNRWQFVNGYWYLSTSAGGSSLTNLGWGKPGDSISSIAENPSQFAIYQQSGGGVSLTSASQNRLNTVLSSSWNSSGCNDLVFALGFGSDLWANRDAHTLYELNNYVLTEFNSYGGHSNYTYEAANFGDANIFYGVPVSYVSGKPIRPMQSPKVRPKPPGHPKKPLMESIEW